MNNTFDFNRFSLLVKRQWVENKKIFLMAVVILLGLGIVLYSSNMSFITGEVLALQGRMTILIGCFFLTGTFFTNYILKDFANKNDGTNLLLIPASHFEKLLSASSYIFIIFPIIYLLLSYILDTTFVNIGNSIMSSYNSGDVIKNDVKNQYLLLYLFNSKTLNLDVLMGIWLMIQSSIMVGSIHFEGWAYIKTAFTGFILFFSMYLIAGFAFETLVTDLAHKVEINSNAYSQIKPTHDMLNNIIFMALKYVFTPILLLIAYFKLKEKQV
jgi:hypothetical protein